MISKYWLNLMKNNLYAKEVCECFKEWADGKIQVLNALELVSFLNDNVLKNPESEFFPVVCEGFRLAFKFSRESRLFSSMTVTNAVNVI